MPMTMSLPSPSPYALYYVPSLPMIYSTVGCFLPVGLMAPLLLPRGLPATFAPSPMNFHLGACHLLGACLLLPAIPLPAPPPLP